jgi:hypothetical protein
MGGVKDAQQVYEQDVRSLPVLERLQLVKLVMDDLMSRPPTWILEEDDAWSDEDYADLMRASLTYAAQSLEEQT